MKVRLGFVSNSSSSSFVVISNRPYKQTDDFNRLKSYYEGRPVIVGSKNYGETEFGWENKKYIGFETKLNFAALQARDIWCGTQEQSKHRSMKLFNMLNTVLKEELEVFDILYPPIDTPGYCAGVEDDWGYIDHSSSSSEGRNLEIFESEEALKQFLFHPSSFIQGENDNEY